MKFWFLKSALLKMEPKQPQGVFVRFLYRTSLPTRMRAIDFILCEMYASLTINLALEIQFRIYFRCFYAMF